MSFPRIAFALSIGALSLNAQDAAEGAWVDFAVEGNIAKMDAELAPRLREGMVFSAVYAVALEADAVDLDEAVSRARYFDVVDDVEVSIDLNYVLVYEASTGIGDRWVELTRAGGDLEVDQDLYSVLLPLKGEPIAEEGWTARWLQMWFYGEGGKLLASTDLQAPPDMFKSGWWRITFWNTEGTRSVLAEGAIEAAGEAGEPLSPSEQIAQLEAAVVRLSSRLEAEQSANQTISAELASARARIEGLQKTVDVIFEERRILQDQYDLLKLEKAEAADPELVDQVASLEADLALRTEEELRWKAENEALAEALSAAESDYARLAETLAELEARLIARSGLPAEVSSVETAAEPAPIVATVAPVVEEPAEIERPQKRKPRSGFRRPGKFSR